MTQISPFLWFDHEAEEAVTFYISLFRDARITRVARYGEAGPGPAGQVMTMSFELNGQEFIALNGGPFAPFSPAISFFVTCDTQAEVDAFWDKLTDGGETQQCGWLTDRYGITWQIVPALLGQLLDDADPVKVQRVTEAMLQMVKLDSAVLQRAYDTA